MIWCIGLNYRRHAEENGIPLPSFPLVFAKGPNSVQNPEDPALIPTRLKSDEVDYEGELVVVIGKACKSVSRQFALDYVSDTAAAQVVQDWNTNDMIFDVPSLIEFLSGSTTLLPGTPIFTEPPPGVGMAQKPPRWLKAGDAVTVAIETSDR
jgi:2-keto-4-pentenoate hydratase/2-oxohepta-3-ene-1,7-dioic acid hydratase in catechol pathway